MTGAEPIVDPTATLAVIIGAKEFPHSPALNASEAFSRSAGDFREYLLSPNGFGLPASNLLDLFNSQKAPSEMLVDIASFLVARQQAVPQEAGIRDILLYYVGHGGFSTSKEYFLAVSATRQKMEGATSLRMSDLASTIRESSRRLRKFIILDCCFSAAAFKEFQSAPLTAARVQTMDAFPKEGTTLLCSSSSRTVSISPDRAYYTMFSGALLSVLRDGDPECEASLSIEQVGTLVKERIAEAYADEGVRPEVHSPDQRTEDIARVPVFPNAAVRLLSLRRHVSSMQTDLKSTKGAIDALGQRLQSIDSRLGPVIELADRVSAYEARLTKIEGGEQNTISRSQQRARDQEMPVGAPTWVIERIHRQNEAARAGIIWTVASFIITTYSIYVTLFYNHLGASVVSPLYFLLNPLNLGPLLIFAFMVALNLPSLIRGGRSYNGDEACVGHESTDHTWETNTVVLRALRTRHFRLIGSIYIATPWFEISLLLYFSQAVVVFYAVINGLQIT